MSKKSIHVENISKQFFIGHKLKINVPLHARIWNLFSQPFQRLQQLSTTNLPEFSDEIFWALQEISFDVNEGEVLGIIGHNGAGKSTLLKILTRITKPTSGFAEIYGRIGSLLEVGTGFHPELTGRENIYLNGTILGMSRQEIDCLFDEIVDFAGVDQFLDTPVKRYSSGMRVRLAFSVAAHLPAEVLLIDEVLAVGDAEFQRKCLDKMNSVARQGRTILFVSHNMASITSLCSRVILLDKGQIVVDGTPNEAISKYLHAASEHHSLFWNKGYSEPGIDEFKLHQVEIHNHENVRSTSLDSRFPFSVHILYEVLKPIKRGRLTVQITNGDGIMILQGYDIDNEEIQTERVPGRYVVNCQIPGQLLRGGTYYLRVGADDQNVKVLAFPEQKLIFQIVDVGSIGSHVQARRLGIVQPHLGWSEQPLKQDLTDETIKTY